MSFLPLLFSWFKEVVLWSEITREYVYVWFFSPIFFKRSPFCFHSTRYFILLTYAIFSIVSSWGGGEGGGFFMRVSRTSNVYAASHSQNTTSTLSPGTYTLKGVNQLVPGLTS